jgi:preprotein translocase subunit SecG
MIHILLNVLYVLIAISMIVLILLQRGAGAQAGSGFGAGASGTVFGARGSANFLSSSTKWLAAIFFSMSLFMAWQASHDAARGPGKTVDLGVMSDLPAAAKPVSPSGAELAPAPAVPASVVEPTPIITPAMPAGATPAGTAAPKPVEGSKGG